MDNTITVTIKGSIYPNINKVEPYSSYRKICSRLLDDYSKCMLEKSEKQSKCDDKLYLIQKLCMNPVGTIIINTNGEIEKNAERGMVGV